MFRKARSWLGDLANLVTLVQVLIALAGAGVLAVVAQKVAEVFLGLSTAERVTLGLCLFLLLLAAFLSRVKVFRERRAAKKSQIEQLSTDLAALQHRYDELERKARETEQERDTIQKEYDSIRGTRNLGQFNAVNLTELAANAEA